MTVASASQIIKRFKLLSSHLRVERKGCHARLNEARADSVNAYVGTSELVCACLSQRDDTKMK